MTMDKKSFYCKLWKHRKFAVNRERYQICISPMINGNDEGTMIQFHGLVLKKRRIMYLGLLKLGITKECASKFLTELEEKIRFIIRKNVSWNKESFEQGNVKIWYFNEKDEDEVIIDDKRIWPPLRFAITLINIIPLKKSKSEEIRELLEQTLIGWVKTVILTE